MNSFEIFVYDNLAKTWSEIPNVAFPLGTGDYLDERLDECYVTFYNGVNHYTSSTVFKIIVDEDGTETVLYYVLDSDSSNEIKVGAGLYKHTLHLLEPTKLLEGILCQTICFTNELGNSKDGIFESTLNYCIPTVFGSPENDIDAALLNVNFGIPGVLKFNQPITLPSLYNVAELFENAINSVASLGVEYTINYTGNDKGDIVLKVYNGTDEITEEYITQEVTLQPKQGIIIEYNIPIELSTIGQVSSGVYFLVTLTFTPPVIGGKYSTFPYTITSMTNRCLALAEPLFKNANNRIYPRFIFDGTTYYYDREGIGVGSQSEYYENVFADEITLSNATLREQLKSIGKLIHAEPRVTISETPLGSGMYNLTYVVRYEKYGENETATALVGKPYSYRKLSQSINEYCTKIRTTAANLVNSLDYDIGVVSDPQTSGEYGVKSLRAESTGVRIEETNAIAETANPIYKLIKVECGILSNDSGYAISLTDITSFVHEKSEYDLMSSYGTVYPNSKAIALYYEQGRPNINGLFFRANVPASVISSVFEYYSIVRILSICTGRSNNEISDLIANNGVASISFRVTYIPLYSTTLSHSKQLYTPGLVDFSQIYNQSENIIEARYYGENIKGAAMKLGNVSEERTYMLPNRSALPKCGEIIDGYTIAAVDSEMLPNYVKCTVALSKDYNRINEYVGINSHKRVYEVSEREAYNRDILIHEYVVFSKANLESDANTMLRDPGKTLFMLRDTYKRDPKEITDVVAISGGRSINLPVISASFGNAMVFTWKYKDNYSAGQSSVYESAGAISGQWGVEVPYSDIYGRANLYEIYLFHGPFVSLLPSSEQPKYPYLMPDIDGLTLPDNLGEISPISTANSGEYILKKDSREKLNTVNYEIEFRTTETDLIIGSALASSNSLVARIEDNFYIYALKNPANKFKRAITIEDVYLDDNGAPVILANTNEISFKTSQNEDTSYPADAKRLIFPNSSFSRSCYWALARELKEETRGPFFFPNGTIETVTEWTGGELLLAGLNEVQPGGKIYNDLYISVRR